MLSTLPDEELARQAQAGSLAAFEHLVWRYEHRVHAFVCQFCRHQTDAAELTQDTFVKAFQRLGQFDVNRDFAAWLFTIARRQCIDRHRSRIPRADDSVLEPVDHEDPAELISRREDGEALWQLARKHLGHHQFQALWLHYAGEMDVASIAQVMGKTRVHVKVLLFRARQILGRQLKPAPARSESALATGPSLGNLSRQSSGLTSLK